jgi:hypothetical protein
MVIATTGTASMAIISILAIISFVPDFMFPYLPVEFRIPVQLFRDFLLRILGWFIPSNR